MVIVNQNANGDDLADDIFKKHEAIGNPVNVIRPYNLEHASDDLITSYRPARINRTEEVPSTAAILSEGVDEETIKDFSNNLVVSTVWTSS